MKAKFKDVRAAVDLADLLVTVTPGLNVKAAAELACNIAGIGDACDRSAVRRLLGCRLSHVYATRTAAA